MQRSLVGSEMCIRDRLNISEHRFARWQSISYKSLILAETRKPPQPGTDPAQVKASGSRAAPSSWPRASGGNLRRVPNCLRTFDVVPCSMIEGFATVSYVLEAKEPLAGSGALRKRVLNPAAPASSRPQNSRKRLESMACQTKMPPNSRNKFESRGVLPKPPLKFQKKL